MVGSTTPEKGHNERQRAYAHQDKQDDCRNCSPVRGFNEILGHGLDVRVDCEAENHKADKL